MNDAEDFDPFAETAKTRQVAARQSDYHNKRFDRAQEATTREFSLVVQNGVLERGQEQGRGREGRGEERVSLPLCA
jgi:splicing factor 3B subunit 1